jgi:hypothetical protein
VIGQMGAEYHGWAVRRLDELEAELREEQEER